MAFTMPDNILFDFQFQFSAPDTRTFTDDGDRQRCVQAVIRCCFNICSLGIIRVQSGWSGRGPGLRHKCTAIRPLPVLSSLAYRRIAAAVRRCRRKLIECYRLV